MVNGQLMYLRPGNLFKDFIIEHSKSDLKSGRPSVSYEGDGTDFLRGFLASANEVDKAHGTADHIITHVIVQRGKPRAERTDRLILGNRMFYIVDIDDIQQEVPFRLENIFNIPSEKITPNIVDVCVWSLYDNSDVMFDYDSMDNHLRELPKEYDIDPDDYEEEEENGKD